MPRSQQQKEAPRTKPRAHPSIELFGKTAALTMVADAKLRSFYQSYTACANGWAFQWPSLTSGR